MELLSHFSSNIHSVREFPSENMKGKHKITHMRKCFSAANCKHIKTEFFCSSMKQKKNEKLLSNSK